MATSRTGTTKWKRLQRQILRQAKAQGQRRCPLCDTLIDWNASKTPASPEADHIVPYAQGGQDEPDNLRVICRHCNQSRGGRQNRTTSQARHKPRVIRTNHQDAW